MFIDVKDVEVIFLLREGGGVQFVSVVHIIYPEVSGLRLSFPEQDCPVVDPAREETGLDILLLLLCNPEYGPVVIVRTQVAVAGNIMLVDPSGSQQVRVAYSGDRRSLVVASDRSAHVAPAISAPG